MKIIILILVKFPWVILNSCLYSEGRLKCYHENPTYNTMCYLVVFPRKRNTFNRLQDFLKKMKMIWREEISQKTIMRKSKGAHWFCVRRPPPDREVSHLEEILREEFILRTHTKHVPLIAYQFTIRNGYWV